MSLGSGVHKPQVIDVVAQRPGSDEYVLVMLESREWDGSTERLAQIQDKINAYLEYVNSGQFCWMYPDATGRPVHIELRCSYEPDPNTVRFIDDARSYLAEHGVTFHLQVSRCSPEDDTGAS